ncbi:terminase family protein [Acinetobacter baumannii]|uniref:terminase family protein n=1 Tax=Acinetobacter baumannii TaxID=470 RepID=UPI0010FBCC91|nr:terminase family protein [Acinetobacter baumannii]EKT9953175.1 terminase family protein [Acinetobacter baumannii]EKU2476513.1 terminase family protein [Acinetobacter baumannii]EKU2484623.1 terminase family protein [Acinetobacter baumannii]EKU4494727.1 terminase family protein [Acinetobacter baumannii]EKU6809647.1 terminase family protein [Acinetobacter baumannii]
MTKTADDEILALLAEMSESEIEQYLLELDEDERAEIIKLLADAPVWFPLEGPQMAAYTSDADIIGYGGAAGGGKTDLIAGLSLNVHKRVLIVRREKAQTDGIVQRIEEIVGHKNGYNTQKSAWRFDNGRLLEFGGLDNMGDEKRWQGRAHDLKALDEATEIRESQAMFVMGWNRTSDPTIKPKCLLTFNPPTTAEGRWVLDFFAPWIKKGYPNPAQPGELRWFARIGGKDQEVESNKPFVLIDDQIVYDFDTNDYKPELIIKPKSRTFIPARVTDNKYYMETGYMSTLQALPEPLRSQMLYGDFGAGIEDDPWQVIPTEWVEAAQARWKPLEDMRILHRGDFKMDSYGLDVARGGGDNTIGFARYAHWYDNPNVLEGKDSPDGPTSASFAVSHVRDHAPIHVDVIGVGASTYDFLKQSGIHVVPVDVRNAATSFDRSGQLSFYNLRSQLWWQFREALDPAYGSTVALPPEPKLLADLTAPRWALQGTKIKVESREEIIKRIGRSPDYGSAIINAQIDTPKRHIMQAINASAARRDYDPYA